MMLLELISLLIKHKQFKKSNFRNVGVDQWLMPNSAYGLNWL